jgi:2-oxoglutarate-Fe(II)-dependent oxygenase superfamily protein
MTSTASMTATLNSPTTTNDATAPSSPDAGAGTLPLFDLAAWSRRLPELERRYREAPPFPSIVLDDFLPAAVARQVLAEFPRPDETSWIQYKHFNENKLGKSDRREFPPYIGRVIDELNSPAFVSFLSRLTGIEGLLADPMLEGGGLHQTESGGFLNIHADFTMHHYHTNWRRRVNLILYLNEGWQDAWGGALELWDRDMHGCARRIAPVFNRAAIFNTDETSFHGYPAPITCPVEVTRKSLALYYFTVAEDRSYVPRATNYQPRPEDGLARRALIWADKRALDLYSRAKIRFGISDDFASRVLGRLGRRK